MSEPADPSDGVGGLVRLRLDLGYDGGGFSGWARQPDRRTVQAVLEEALVTVLRLRVVRVTCAGRTDTGVHARGQVAHADVPPDLLAAQGDELTLGRRLAGILPTDVRVHRVAVAAPGFDARFGALWRRYAYRVSDRPLGVDPLRRHDVLDHRRALDETAMDDAGRLIEGAHDFAAFCRLRPGATTVRNLLEHRWSRDADGYLVGRVVADAFCHNMVRAMVGAVLVVGEGRRAPGWVGEVMAGSVRRPDVPVVAPHGLTLEEVRYPPDEELAARSAATRRRRGEPT